MKPPSDRCTTSSQICTMLADVTATPERGTSTIRAIEQSADGCSVSCVLVEAPATSVENLGARL